ncbi:MAG: lipopolysaccharide heptosyltransferase II [Candidatus Omnitrophota bacterium]
MKTYRNILVVRTDRVGDVVLTTPSLEALRKAFPSSKISILVAPQTREIVEGNPHIDEIIVDDRKGLQKGFWRFWKLVLFLRRKKFDLAIIFHTKRRTNFLCFHAGIPHRLGYKNKKGGFLLTQGVEDKRIEGTRHEAQYCLDLLRFIGVEPVDLKLSIVVSEGSVRWADDFLKKQGIEKGELIAIHPGASCISKRWPAQRFANVIDQVVSKYGAKVVLVGDQDTKKISQKILSCVHSSVIDLTGQTSIGQLAALFKKCRLLISNDSGPVHVACAVGLPVISIFGRNQAGLSPTRWKPLGPKDIVLHKEVGCEICLAHNCRIDFECLKALQPGDVLEAVDAQFKL